MRGTFFYKLTFPVLCALGVAACSSSGNNGTGPGDLNPDAGDDGSSGGGDTAFGDENPIAFDTGTPSEAGDGGATCPGHQTCADLGANCGQQPDGCGGLQDCGTCTNPGESCGGGGTPNVCGANNTCTKRTCADAGANCGPVADGCGGLLDCGTCSNPLEVCGGGGTASVCGVPADTGITCTPKKCSDVAGSCGPIPDGCGNLLDCGTCSGGQTCDPSTSVCTTPVDAGPTCTPKTCTDLGANCGQQSDGCGGLIDCGTCPTGQACGGGGTPNVCGKADTGACVAKTCADLAANCGQQSDGCGGLIDCGTCAAPDTCGGGGTANVCGSPPCKPKSCTDLGANCGSQLDGCGGVLDCGTCTAPATCGGGGTPSVCGTPACKPKTCTDLGINCGPAGDGCGGTIQCGTCPTGQVCGAVTASVCGVPPCTPKTCAQLGASCGLQNDGCNNVINCGGCTAPATCGGGGTPNVCGGNSGGCGVGSPTTVSGTVLAPTPAAFGTPDPIYNAVVYMPSTAVAPFTKGVACETCGTALSGNPIAASITGPDGKFTLTGVPCGKQTIVIQVGHWRRQVQVNLACCATNTLTADQSRLPRNQSEGDIPQMAINTGWIDPLECVLRKIGIDDKEFTLPTFALASGAYNGRVHMYYGNGAQVGADAGCSCSPASTTTCSCKKNTTPAGDLLWFGGKYNNVNVAEQLPNYDLALFSCQAANQTISTTSEANLLAYLNEGGRLFATHWSNAWLANYSPFSGTGPWNVGQNNPTASDTTALVGHIDTLMGPRQKAFGQWLDIVGASISKGSNSIDILASRHDMDDAPTPVTNPPGTWPATYNSERWIYSNTDTKHSAADGTVQHYTFNTPIGVASDKQCGRALFSDFHVNQLQSTDSGQSFPSECATGPLTAQEKVLEFMLFDISSCVGTITPPPSCVPATCASLGATCGQIADGCGGLLTCGSCTAPATCGGGGKPNVCGSSCKPLTCASAGADCGPVADGCGGSLDCGTCKSPATCGGGGTPSVCGTPACTPKTCAQVGATCGNVGDGCGNTIGCGTCTAPAVCGGGGTPNVCGTGTCTSKTCAQLGATCGNVGDGCGNAINCGTCTAPDTCGGGGTPNACGHPSCTPTTCAAVGAQCGPIGDGCGGILTCGTCPSGFTCEGNPSKCVGTTCTPKTCAQLGANCGPEPDGCGNIIQCGTCTAPQTCGGGGTPSVCGGTTGTCTPRTCAQAGANCGPVADGCGGTIQCGTCTAPQTCGGGGTPSVCGGNNGCTPRTCAAAGANCGPISDGCGGIVDCGSCVAPQTCGGSGVANQCGGIK